MDLPLSLAGTLLLAQAPPGAAPTPSAISDAGALPVIALKRWFGSLTLTSPQALTSRVGLIAFLAGLAGLLALAVAAQGPRRALGQFLDLAGLARTLSAGVARLRRSGRVLAILLGATVVSWTAWQAPLHGRSEKKDELALVLKARTRADVAIEHGSLAALTPFRDVAGLGDTLILLVAAAAMVFKFSADRWGRLDSGGPLSGRATLAWAGTGLYALYRLASLIVNAEGFPPLGGCLFVEVAAIPALMLLADGLILAWLLAELRGGTEAEDDGLPDVAGALALLPAACLACAASLPARYLATFVGLAFAHHLPSSYDQSPWVQSFLGGWGLAWVQAGSLALAGLLGASATSGGTWGGALRSYGRMLRVEGGRVAAVVGIAGAGVGATSAAAYYAVLALPAQPWVLLAADSYAHYASLPIGLVGLAALVEIAARVSPPPFVEEPDGPKIALGDEDPAG